MDQASNVVRGILHPDGTLELAERPTLPAGEVEVTIRPVVKAVAGENWLEYLMRARAELEAAGSPFRTKEEIDAELADDRDWGEDRLEEARRQTEPEESTVSDTPTEKAASSEAPRETLWEAMQRSRAELEASGYRFQTSEETDNDLADDQDWDAEFPQEHLRQAKIVDAPLLDTPNDMTGSPADSKNGRENWFQYLQRTRAELEASSAIFRSKEEIDADIEDMRDWDSRLDEIRLQIEGGRGDSKNGT